MQKLLEATGQHEPDEAKGGHERSHQVERRLETRAEMSLGATTARHLTGWYSRSVGGTAAQYRRRRERPRRAGPPPCTAWAGRPRRSRRRHGEPPLNVREPARSAPPRLPRRPWRGSRRVRAHPNLRVHAFCQIATIGQISGRRSAPRAARFGGGERPRTLKSSPRAADRRTACDRLDEPRPPHWQGEALSLPLWCLSRRPLWAASGAWARAPCGSSPMRRRSGRRDGPRERPAPAAEAPAARA